MGVVIKGKPWGKFKPWANVELTQEDFARFQEDGRALRSTLNLLRKLYPEPPADTFKL